MIHVPSTQLYANQTGLTDIGYRLRNASGTIFAGPTFTGITERPVAFYQAAQISVSDTLTGFLEEWGSAAALTANTPFTSEWVDVPAVGSGAGSVTTVGSVSTVILGQDALIIPLGMSRGEKKTFRFTLPPLDLQGNPVDVTQWTEVLFMAKLSLSDDDGAALISKRKGAGAGSITTVKVDPDNVGAKNVFDVNIASADTNVPAVQPAYPANPYYTLTGILATGNLKEMARGFLEILPRTQAGVA